MALGLIKKPNLVPLESANETHLRDLVKDMGGKAWKFTSPANRSVPDRLVVLPGTRRHPHFFLVEEKREGKQPTTAQWDEINTFRSLGIRVYVSDSKTRNAEILLFEQIVFSPKNAKGLASSAAKGSRVDREKTLQRSLSIHGSWEDRNLAGSVRRTLSTKFNRTRLSGGTAARGRQRVG